MSDDLMSGLCKEEQAPRLIRAICPGPSPANPLGSRVKAG
jgi:hypothetical protein